jgi:hypothetical protein
MTYEIPGLTAAEHVAFFGPEWYEEDRTEERLGVLYDWIDQTEAAIEALKEWREYLIGWRDDIRDGVRTDYDTFLDIYNKVVTQGGVDGWADGCPAGGGLDALAEAVTDGEGM